MLCHSLRDYGGISSWRQTPSFALCTIRYPIWFGIHYQKYQLEDISFVYFRLGFTELRRSICIGYEGRCYVYVFEMELMVIFSRQKSLSGCYVYDGWIRKTPYLFHFVMCIVKRTHWIWYVCKAVMAHPLTLVSLGWIHGTSFLVVHNLGYIMYLAAALCRYHRELKCNIHWFENSCYVPYCSQ